MIVKIGGGEEKVPARAMEKKSSLFSLQDEVSRQSALKRARRWYNDAKKLLANSTSL